MDLSALFANMFKPSAGTLPTSIYPTQTPFSSELAGAPSPGQLTNVPTMTGGQINPQAAAMQAAQQNPTPDASTSPTLAALLGGLKAAGGQQGGSQVPQANGGNGGMQSNTAQLAAYKPMNFAGKAMLPPQIMQALMAMGGR